MQLIKICLFHFPHTVFTQSCQLVWIGVVKFSRFIFEFSRLCICICLYINMKDTAGKSAIKQLAWIGLDWETAFGERDAGKILHRLKIRWMIPTWQSPHFNEKWNLGTLSKRVCVVLYREPKVELFHQHPIWESGKERSLVLPNV